MKIIKRVLKAVLIWFLAMIAMYIIFSRIFPTGSDMPLILSFFILLFPVFCAVYFSRPRAQSKKGTPPKKKKPTPKQSKSALSSMALVDQMDGHEFERFTADLLRKLGYTQVEVTPGSGDQGVDVIAVREGKRYAIQCKRYSQKLGNKPVQEVYAGKTIYGCSVAVVLTNNYFTEGAREAALSTGVELWDRDTLQRMMDFADYKAIV